MRTLASRSRGIPGFSRKTFSRRGRGDSRVVGGRWSNGMGSPLRLRDKPPGEAEFGRESTRCKNPLANFGDLGDSRDCQHHEIPGLWPICSPPPRRVCYFWVSDFLQKSCGTRGQDLPARAHSLPEILHPVETKDVRVCVRNTWVCRGPGAWGWRGFEEDELDAAATMAMMVRDFYNLAKLKHVVSTQH